MVREVRNGTKTARQAAIEISRPCHCGIVNVPIVERLLTEMAEEA